jgi:hypothetical protein
VIEFRLILLLSTPELTYYGVVSELAESYATVAVTIVIGRIVYAVAETDFDLFKCLVHLSRVKHAASTCVFDVRQRGSRMH